MAFDTTEPVEGSGIDALQQQLTPQMQGVEPDSGRTTDVWFWVFDAWPSTF